MRINKYLSQAGICSRRGADSLIDQGRVTVDGTVAEHGMAVSEDSLVRVDNKVIELESQKVLLLFNKPKGIVCTSQKHEKDNIIDFINYPQRIFPVGRLDKESRGLILLTNEGELANELMMARNEHEREYEVVIDKSVTKEFVERMSRPMFLKELECTTRPCKVKKLSKNKFSIVLTQGLNRQIRRMCNELGVRVIDLKRIRIENLKLGDIKEGHFREITDKERQSLLALIKSDE